jgi:transaldolase
MVGFEALNVKIYADGADFPTMIKYAENPIIKGFTTNPSLMHGAGVKDYVTFAKQVIEKIPDRDISFEVFADDFSEMEAQAKVISSWGENVYAKIPITNSRGDSSCPTIGRLTKSGVKVNVTAVFTARQVEDIRSVLSVDSVAVISVFAGRIADAGQDPMPVLRECKEMLNGLPKAELLWASTREVFNIFQADQAGCDIITVAKDVLGKLSTIGKDLETYSLETVQAFCHDAETAGFTIPTD